MSGIGRKIIAYIATSADGFIARKDGGIDWLDRPRSGDYGMNDFLKSIDAVIWGRTTYDEALARSPRGFGMKIHNYVFTHRPATPAKGVTFVNEPVREFAARLRSQPGKDIWMMGGGGVIASFLDAGELDELIIHVIPTFIGEGIPLIAPARRTVPLAVVAASPYPDGVVRLHYRVEKAAAVAARPSRRRSRATITA